MRLRRICRLETLRGGAGVRHLATRTLVESRSGHGATRGQAAAVVAGVRAGLPVPIQYDSIYRRFIKPNVADWALRDLRLTPALVTLIEQAGMGYDRIAETFVLDANGAETNLRPERLPEAISRAAVKARQAGKPLDSLISEAWHKFDSFRANALRLVPVRDVSGAITGYTEAKPAREPSAVQAMRYGLIIQHVALPMAADERDRRYVDEKAKGESGDTEFCEALEFAPSCLSLIGVEAKRIAYRQHLMAVGLDDQLRAEEFGVSALVRLKDAFHAFIDEHAGTERRSADVRTRDTGQRGGIVHDGLTSAPVSPTEHST